MAEKSILLVEREDGIREILQFCLHDIGGWNVMVACSDREGLEQLAIAQPKPDAIIFDILLPEEKDGYRFLKELHNLFPNDRPPIVLITSLAKCLSRIDMKELGVVGAIAKPFDSRLLSRDLAQLLGWLP